MITRRRRSIIVTTVALTAPWIKKAYDEKTKQQAKDSYFERVSMRGVERIFHVPRQRLAHWLVEEGEPLSEELSSTLAEPEADEVVELDEVWSFWERIPDAYRTAQTYSDFWEAYRNVFPEETHRSVGKEAGQTNHVERWNNTLRQRLARLVRRTLSFSKSDFFHELVIKLFIYRYNRLRLAAISQT